MISLTDQLSTAVLMLNGSLEIFYLNPAAENLLEISLHQAQDCSFVDLIHTNHYLKNQLLVTLKEQHPYTEHALVVHVPSGQKTVDITVTPISSSEIVIELIHVDYQLKISRVENLLLQQQAMKDLLRGLAHEIKNPLGGLRGAAQLLEQELSSVELKEYTQVIINEADRLSNLVDRIHGPRHMPKKSICNIHAAIERVVHLLVAENNQLEIIREYDPSIPELFADQNLLVQALLNIVRNAVQAGAKQITIMTRTQSNFMIGHKHHKLVAKISIIDNGSGIAPEIIEKIFYPMVTGRPDGSGLGLAIAQSIMNEHDGLIECSSEPGRTIFSILLPLDKHDR